NRSSPVLAQTTAIFVAANMVQTFVGKPDGTLWGLGLNDYGQLGNGTTTTPQLTLAPALNGITGGVKKICGSDAHTIALTAAGEVWGAGFNSYGALGDGTLVDKPTPVRAI